MEKKEIRESIQRFRKFNDQEAFRVLFELYQKQIWAYIQSKIKRHDQAENVFQEVGLEVARFLVRTNPNHFMAVVYHITKSKIAEYFRKLGPVSVSMEDLGDDMLETNACDDPAGDLEMHDTYRLALYGSGLSVTQRETLVLHYFVGYPLKDIAELMEVPEETVKSRIYLGKKRVKAYFDKKERSCPRCLTKKS